MRGDVTIPCSAHATRRSTRRCCHCNAEMRRRQRRSFAVGGWRAVGKSGIETDDEKMLKRTKAWDTFDTESTAGLSVIEEEHSSQEDMVVPPKTGARDDTPLAARNCPSLLDDDDEEEDEEREGSSIDSSPKMQRKRVDFVTTPSGTCDHRSASSPPRIVRTHRFLPLVITSTHQQSPQSRATSIRSQPGTETASQVVEPLSCREKIEQVGRSAFKTCSRQIMTLTHLHHILGTKACTCM